MSKFFVLSLLILGTQLTHANEACLGQVEGQVLSLAESQVKAKGNGILDSRVTLLHNYGCSGDPDTNMRCFVDSKVYVLDNDRQATYYSFQSSYRTGQDCAAKGNVKTVQSKTVLEGDAADNRKGNDDVEMMTNIFPSGE